MTKKNNKNREDNYLRPRKEIFVSDGKVTYNERSRSWGIIRLQSPFIKLFPELKDRQNRYKYSIFVYRSYDEMADSLMEMKRQGKPLPIFLFLSKEKIEKNIS